MKILQIVFCSLLLSMAVETYSQKEHKQLVDTVIKVDGICKMCKTRIENALDLKGVKLADWDKSTHDLRLVYRKDKVTLTSLVDAINEAGHDTENSKATDEQYNNVHKCCRYREQEAH